MSRGAGEPASGPAARSRGGRYDTSSLRTICSAGTAWSARIKQRLLEHLPHAALLDFCGSTEGVTYGFRRVRRGDQAFTANFEAAGGLKGDRPGSAAQRGARPLGRAHVRHSAQRPEQDLICRSSNLPASQRMSVLMQEHNKKERQILEHVPDYGGINLRSVADFERHEQETNTNASTHQSPRSGTTGCFGTCFSWPAIIGG